MGEIVDVIAAAATDANDGYVYPLIGARDTG